MQPFRFKQFEVRHDRCAMKVNTDGVLLGAWANVNGARRALDVGTGSGVIAMMLAQRGAGEVVALEIDCDAADQAKENFGTSAWAERMETHALALQQFVPTAPFDLLVSNPPYFENAYKTPVANRNLARHNDSLPLTDLITFAAQWLTDTGKLAIILPADMEAQAKELATAHTLFLLRCCYVKGTTGSEPKRVLLEFGRHPQEPIISSIAIETAPLQYTPEYKELTKDFYLAF